MGINPEHIDYYQNKGIEFRIYHFPDELRFWIKGGVGFIEFDEEGLEGLFNLLLEYFTEASQS